MAARPLFSAKPVVSLKQSSMKQIIGAGKPRSPTNGREYSMPTQEERLIALEFDDEAAHPVADGIGDTRGTIDRLRIRPQTFQDRDYQSLR